jgi:hypothetical protein
MLIKHSYQKTFSHLASVLIDSLAVVLLMMNHRLLHRLPPIIALV